jgi:hypothetical protein
MCGKSFGICHYVYIFLVVTCTLVHGVDGTEHYFEVRVLEQVGDFAYHGNIECESGLEFWVIEIFINRAWF